MGKERARKRVPDIPVGMLWVPQRHAVMCDAIGQNRQIYCTGTAQAEDQSHLVVHVLETELDAGFLAETGAYSQHKVHI